MPRGPLLLMRRVSLVLLFVLGCAPRSSAPSNVSTRQPGAPGPAVASEPPDPATAFDGPVPAGCEGAQVDLSQVRACSCKRLFETFRDGKRRIRMAMWCGPEFEGMALPSALELSLVVKPSVITPGSTFRVELLLRNRSARAMPIRIDDSMIQHYLIVRDAEGNDTRETGPCRSGMSATNNEHLIVLAPSGEARVAMPVAAITRPSELRHGECHELPDRPLSAGRYEVELRPPIAGAPLIRTAIEVR